MGSHCGHTWSLYVPDSSYAIDPRDRLKQICRGPFALVLCGAPHSRASLWLLSLFYFIFCSCGSRIIVIAMLYSIRLRFNGARLFLCLFICEHTYADV